jgi:NADPH2:quinone reductase
LALFGASSGPVPPFDLTLLNAKGSLFITRPSLPFYIATHEELEWRSRDILGWVASGELKLRMEHVFPLEQAHKAHEALEGRGTTGKILLEP